MNPTLRHLVAFCLAHGTPKLKAATRGAVIGHLHWAGCVNGLVWIRRDGVTVGLGVAWPVRESWVPGPGSRVGIWDPYAAHDPMSRTVYIANLVALDGAALRAMLAAAKVRWPCTERWIGHRVAKCKRLDPAAQGELMTYPGRAQERLDRLVERAITA